MTVGELIEKLRTLPPDAVAIIEGGDGGGEYYGANWRPGFVDDPEMPTRFLDAAGPKASHPAVMF